MTELHSESRTASTTDYVLPAPPRGATPLDTLASRRTQTTHRHAEAAAILGRRMALFGEVQQLHLAELRQRLGELEAMLPDASRAQLQGAVREVLGVLDWCDEVQQDQVREANYASLGWMPLDVGTLCSALAQELPDVLSAPSRPTSWWGDGRLLDELLRAAIALVAERQGGKGRVVLEVDEAPSGPTVAVLGSADPVDELDPGAADRFRTLARQVGARITPGPLGPMAAGLVLHLGHPTP